MATATLTIAAHPSFHDAGRVLGLVHADGAPGDPEGSRRWRLTSDLNALDRPDPEFLPCDDATGAHETLEARFPAPHPELSRIGSFAPVPRFGRGHGRHSNLDPDTWIVLPIPQLVGKLIPAKIPQLIELAAGHGPFLIPRAQVELLRGLESFDQSDLVIAQEPGCDFATIRFAPARSQARRTRARNREAKAVEDRKQTRAVASMVTRIEELCRAIRHDLEPLGITPALVEILHHQQSETWPHHTHQPHRPGRGWCARPSQHVTATRTPLEILRALCRIHERFRGKSAYRRLPAWERLHAEFRTLPQKLDPQCRGVLGNREDLQRFWSREMKARRPARLSRQSRHDAP